MRDSCTTGENEGGPLMIDNAAAFPSQFSSVSCSLGPSSSRYEESHCPFRTPTQQSKATARNAQRSVQFKALALPYLSEGGEQTTGAERNRGAKQGKERKNEKFVTNRVRKRGLACRLASQDSIPSTIPISHSSSTYCYNNAPVSDLQHYGLA